jgi:uncharacterized protein YndB with AHSA1/START domain
VVAIQDLSIDREGLSLSIRAEFAAEMTVLWQLWADPRQLERWWGPPGYPSTVEQHDLSVGGQVSYYMTGPEGEQHYGWWRITSAHPPQGLEWEDGFADSSGFPLPELPTINIKLALLDLPHRQSNPATEMVLVASFSSRADQDRLLGMGMAEGLRAAVNQIPEVLAL